MTPERLIIESLLTIADKDGNDVPMFLNEAQARIDDSLTGRDLYPKARQEGVSSYFLARYFVKCLSQRNTRAVVISHDRESTQRMLIKVHKFIEHMDPKPVIAHASKNEITFPKMDSMIYLGTAGSRKFGRGDTITHLHCSEIAFWQNADELITGLLQAVPRSGEIAMESTGNGQGNYYHRMCMDAKAGRSHYKLHFLPWHTFSEYDLSVSPAEELAILGSLDKELEEDILVQQHGLTAGQIKFRRERLAELNWDVRRFKQEYPMTLEECFQSSGSGIFSKINFIETDRWEYITPQLHLLDPHPMPGRSYLIGADVSGGIGKDRSVVEILDLSTLEQVGEWVDDSIPPDDFAHVIADLGKRFNNAFICVEANNYGITTLDHLSACYPRELLYYESKRTPVGANEYESLINLGFRTTALSKPFIIGKLRSLLVTDIVIHSPDLYSELSSFVEHENGTLGAVEGCFDDRVMSLAMTVVAVNKASMRASIDREKPQVLLRKDPFSLDSIISEMHARQRRYPISDQAAFPIMTAPISDIIGT